MRSPRSRCPGDVTQDPRPAAAHRLGDEGAGPGRAARDPSRPTSGRGPPVPVPATTAGQLRITVLATSAPGAVVRICEVGFGTPGWSATPAGGPLLHHGGDPGRRTAAGAPARPAGGQAPILAGECRDGDVRLAPGPRAPRSRRLGAGPPRAARPHAARPWSAPVRCPTSPSPRASARATRSRRRQRRTLAAGRRPVARPALVGAGRTGASGSRSRSTATPTAGSSRPGRAGTLAGQVDAAADYGVAGALRASASSSCSGSRSPAATAGGGAAAGPRVGRPRAAEPWAWLAARRSRARPRHLGSGAPLPSWRRGTRSTGRVRTSRCSLPPVLAVPVAWVAGTPPAGGS